MEINVNSKLDDIRSAITGIWDINQSDEDWKCLSLGKARLFKKVCKSGTNLLPDKFISERKDVNPLLIFTKDGMTGMTVNLQQKTFELKESALCLIIQF